MSAREPTLMPPAESAPAAPRGAWGAVFDLPRIADYLVVALAVSLPWSTSVTSILVVLWLLALIPTLDFAELRRTVMRPAGGLPILLWLLAAAGMLWADVSWADRLYGLRYYHKLLVVPLLLVQFRRSSVGWHVLTAFATSCTALLAVSWLTTLWPSLHWSENRPIGIPTKDRIVQATEFLLCAGALGHLTISAWQSHRKVLAAALALLACVFVANVFVVTLARTGLIVIPVLLLLIGWQRYGARGAAILLAGGLVAGSGVLAGSQSVREGVIDAIGGIAEFQGKAPTTSSGMRLEFWRQSVEFISEAPIFGNGTGSTRALSVEVAREEGVAQSGVMQHNPHNQTLAVGVQLGFVGILLLYAFWLAHAALFRGTDLAAWLGMLLVVQNVVSSLINSHLFDFTPGWIYVFGVGVLGGIVTQRRSQPQALAEPGRGAL